MAELDPVALAEEVARLKAWQRDAARLWKERGICGDWPEFENSSSCKLGQMMQAVLKEEPDAGTDAG